MSTKKQNDILRALARILLAFLFLFGQTASARQDQNGKDKADSKPAAKPQQSPAKPSAAPEEKTATAEDESITPGKSPAEENSQHGGQQEGIKVHGHWTIEVRNPDGTLVTHREFENSLQQRFGAFLLAQLLSGDLVSGPWFVDLGGLPQPCFNSGTPGTGPISCQIFPNRPSVPCPADTFVFCNLQTSAVSGQFVLTGTAVAGEVGNISQVDTQFVACDSSNTPVACFQIPPPFYNATLGLFTFTKLAQPIQVSTGQTIAVTVTISFS